MIALSKQINLGSSSARISNYPLNSYCYFELPNMMKRHDHIKYITLGVSHAEIPVSWYIINNSNNLLVINLNGTGDIEYDLTNGNYNANTFKTMLLVLLGASWDINLDSSTGKYTLSHDTYEFVINGYTSTCQKIMGFNENTNYSSSSLSVTFPNPCNFLGTSKINIKSSTLQLDNLDSSTNGHSGSITSISNNAELYGVILYNNQNNFKNLIYNDFLNGIDISITDQDNNLIDFNGIDWYITIQIDEYLSFDDISSENNLVKLMKQQ